MNKKNILRIAAAVSAALLLGGFYFYFKDDIAQEKADIDLLPFRSIMVSQGTLDEITDDLMETTAADTAAVNVSYTTANEAPVTASDTIPDEVRQSLMESVQSLNETYPDAIGWLYMPNTNISYPVTQGNDNEYYLTHAYDGSSLSAGTIFLDCRCMFGVSLIFDVTLRSLIYSIMTLLKRYPLLGQPLFLDFLSLNLMCAPNRLSSLGVT